MNNKVIERLIAAALIVATSAQISVLALNYIVESNPIPVSSQLLPYRTAIVCAEGCDMGKAINDIYIGIGLSKSARIATAYRPLEIDLPSGVFVLSNTIDLRPDTILNGSNTTLEQQPLIHMGNGGRETVQYISFHGAPMILVSNQTDAFVINTSFTQ